MKREEAERTAEIIMRLLDGHDVTVVQVIGNNPPTVHIHHRVTSVRFVGYGDDDDSGGIGLRHAGDGGYVIPNIGTVTIQPNDRSVRGVTTNDYGDTIHFAFVVTDEKRGEVYAAFENAREELAQ